MFFFKQKTAYEMRISDWSSDVCSSDLVHDLLLFEQLGEQDVERDDRHDDENAERHLRNQAAFAKSGDEAVRIGDRGGRGDRARMVMSIWRCSLLDQYFELESGSSGAARSPPCAPETG